ncbi:restriction endonuclease subunit S [Citrobacter sp. Igbk 16]|uniref:restriction endonuclease subunit S n=1 Tax=Citrobacter sp. Igbk 16 TaxID=2963958 RepID=UPI002304492B|nr:restriction endonuclease subunit S [Citrobacter sp. Igbk 16]MDA8516707.1 restriction endonuclease subunit S [Citrobacter sp. Igbk 16]
MAKYKTYPEYRDSGVEWLGEIPINWSLKKAKYIFEKIQRPLRNIDGVVTAFRDGQVTLRVNRRNDGFTNSVKEIGYQGVRSGDLIIHAMDGFAGAIGVSDSDGKCSPVCSVCIPWKRESVNIYFYGYLVRQLAVTDFILSLAKGIRERSTEFRFSEFSGLVLAIPPKDEQDKIVAFLKHETIKIDTLIDKQQQLIKLLKEKSQAVISHAVTKGLNPDVPMKDSGVEWLGAIPRNWNCVAIKNICKIVNGSTPKSSIEEYWDGDIDWFTPTDLSHKETIQVNDSLRKITNSGFLSCGTTMVPANTVILSSRAPIGSLAITKKSACTNQGCKSLVTFSAQLSKYIYYSLLTFNSPLNNLGRGSTFLELSSDDLGGFKISLPNDDMGEIIKYIDMTILKIDNLIEKQLQQIALLKERRTALISSAVTGKIDVRHWRAPDEQTAAEAEAVV